MIRKVVSCTTPTASRSSPRCKLLIHLCIYITTLAILSSPSTAHSEELYFILNGKSFHTSNHANKKLNERNYGAGFLYEFNAIERRWVPFVHAGGLTDSYNNPSYYAGGGIMRRYHPIRRWAGFRIDAGLTGFFMTRKDVNDNEPYPAVLPMLSMGNNSVALNLTYIPEINGLSDEVWFMQLKLNLLNF